MSYLCSALCCGCGCCLNDIEMPRHPVIQKKLLLLGNAEAGKSTFLKQMKLIHGRGFKAEERSRTIPLIYQQILSIIRSLCTFMKRLSINFDQQSNEEHSRALLSPNGNPVCSLTPVVVEAIKSIWADAGVKSCYDRRREYRLTDSARYFLDEIDRISALNYVPTDDDMLRVRIPTTEIVQEDFQIPSLQLQVIDVGGSKSERLKWIHCFDNVTAVIFLASLSEYDQNLINDTPEQNSMTESQALFRVILTTDYFRNAWIILFLNKIDLFQEQLTAKPLRCVYPEYRGVDNDVDQAKRFIKDEFTNMAREDDIHRPRDIYSHFTCAVDRRNIEIVFKEVKQHIVDENIIDCNLF